MKPRLNPILVEAPQRSEEWHLARLGKVTGSKVGETFLSVSSDAKGAAIRELLQVKQLNAKVKATPEFIELWGMDSFELLKRAGMEPIESEKRKKYREEMVAERFTRMRADPDGFVTNDMKWGIANEQVAINRYQLALKMMVDPAPFMLHRGVDDNGQEETLDCGASPDGLVVDRQTGLLGVVEIKCLRSANHLFKIITANDVPQEYIPQIQMEIWISGRDFCDFIGCDQRVGKGLDIFIKRVARDDDYIDNTLEPFVRQFLFECDSKERFLRMKQRENLERIDAWLQIPTLA